MRQFVIDELSPMEKDNIDSWLKRNLACGPLQGIYWLVLKEEELDSAQQGEKHREHGPFYMAIEVNHKEVRFEFLVRSQTTLHCSCIAQATPRQRQLMLDIIDKILEEEMISA